MHTHSVEVSGSTLTKRYVSWSGDEPGREWAALRFISTVAPDLVPTPLERGPHPSVSMTVVPGRPLGGSLTSGEFDALERALRQLWSIPPDGLPSIGFAAFVDRIRAAVAVLEDQETTAVAHNWLETGAADELTVVRDPVIGHGDPNLANYLFDGRRVRIVDFEDAGRSDLAFELANLVEHLSGRGTEWGNFIRRFAVDPDRFHAARCLYAIFWLTLVAPGGPSAARNPPGTAKLQAERVMALIKRVGA